MGSIGCPETSVRNYHYPLLDNLEERNSHSAQEFQPRGFSEDIRLLYERPYRQTPNINAGVSSSMVVYCARNRFSNLYTFYVRSLNLTF
jgi:hypothetical protein